MITNICPKSLSIIERPIDNHLLSLQINNFKLIQILYDQYQNVHIDVKRNSCPILVAVFLDKILDIIF